MSAQNTPKFSKKAFRAQNFRRLRRAIRGFAYRTVPDSPESATLAVTIIPVSPEGGVAAPGLQVALVPVGLSWNAELVSVVLASAGLS